MLIVAVLFLPIIFVVVAALAAVVVVRRSSLRISSEGVEVQNYPQARRLIPLGQVAHFEATPRVGNFAFIRPPTAVLVLVDGTRVAVRAVKAPEAGQGVEALNQRVEALRHVG